LDAIFGEATLSAPRTVRMPGTASAPAQRTSGYILAEMQYLQRTYRMPGGERRAYAGGGKNAAARIAAVGDLATVEDPGNSALSSWTWG